MLGSAFVRPRTSSLPVALFLMALCTLVLPTSVSATDQPGPCDLHQRDGETTHHLMKRRIACAVDRFGPVPGGVERAICIARRESGLNPRASSETGMYLGLYQHAAEYWPARYAVNTNDAWELPESALNGRSNSIVTIRMVVKLGSWDDAGWARGDC
jgi:hypothetical protein